MNGSKIMLIACGSYNPPTPMHLRMFEIARDHYMQLGTHHVIGGIISPVHDSYGKKGLIPAKHRCSMVKLALQTSNWIRLSDWECSQDKWTRTRLSLQYHQNYVNSYINDINGTANELIPGWIPEDIKKIKENVQVKLLCGADLLESFAVPGLWDDDDLEAILGEHGLVVITRSGNDPEKFIFESDLLTKHKRNIAIITNWVPNDVSSTLARRFLSRGLSVKYLLDDFIIEYIKKFNLYGVNNTQNIPSNSTESQRQQKQQQSRKDMKRSNIFCCDPIKVKSMMHRPGQAVKVMNPMGAHILNYGVNPDDINNDYFNCYNNKNYHNNKTNNNDNHDDDDKNNDTIDNVDDNDDDEDDDDDNTLIEVQVKKQKTSASACHV